MLGVESKSSSSSASHDVNANFFNPANALLNDPMRNIYNEVDRLFEVDILTFYLKSLCSHEGHEKKHQKQQQSSEAIVRTNAIIKGTYISIFGFTHCTYNFN